MRSECQGQVESLREQLVLFTGRLQLSYGHMDRTAAHGEARSEGARIALDRNRSVTVLVQGDLEAGRVTDPVNVLSKKCVFVAEQRRTGNHICVVDAQGFEDLLEGFPAPCLQISVRDPAGMVTLSLPAVLSPLGGPVVATKIPHHDPVELTLDLDQLDRGTAAHEATLMALNTHLTGAGRLPGSGCPRFDLGWQVGSSLHVAEVKSLSGSETQQIRLGLGQVLEYAHRLSIAGWEEASEVIPVLVLSQEPSDQAWLTICEELGVLLTWAPGFPGV